MKRILFTGQFPPPVNGASMNNQNIRESKLINNEFLIDYINIVTSSSIADISKWSFKKIRDTFKIIFEIIRTVRKRNHALAILTLSPIGAGLIKDIAIALVFKFFNVKTVLLLHGKGIKVSYGKNIFYTWFLKFTFKKSYVITLAHSLKYDFNFLKFKKDYVLTCGIKQVAFSDSSLNRSYSPFRIVFMSNLVKTKGILELIDAIRILPENIKPHVQLDLICNEGDLTFADINKYIQSLDLTNNVNVLGPKYDKEKQEILSNGSCFVLASYYPLEGMPLAILDALQFALPVITCNNGAIADLIQDGFNGFLVDVQSSQMIADKLSYLIQNQSICKKMSSNAYQSFIENYTTEKFETTFCSILNDVSLDIL